MDRETKIGHLNFAGLVASHLQDDFVHLEHKVLQTTHDINEMTERLEAIKQGMEDVHEDEDHEGLAIAAIDAFGRSVTNLSVALAHMKHKREVYGLALSSVRAASVELNHFVNAIPGILTADE